MWPAPSACLSDGPGHEVGRGVFSPIRLIKLVCTSFKIRNVSIFQLELKFVTSISSESYQIVSSKIVGHLSVTSHLSIGDQKDFQSCLAFHFTLFLQGT